MKLTRIAALTALVAMLAMFAPPPPVSADGAASTRNILIGGAAATLIILNHNRKVHERYAEDAQKQAALAQQRDNAWAAYNAEKTAYEHEAAVADSLRSEVSYQHDQIVGLRKQMASASSVPQHNYVASTIAKVPSPTGATQKVALVSYGWGTF